MCAPLPGMTAAARAPAGCAGATTGVPAGVAGAAMSAPLPGMTATARAPAGAVELTWRWSSWWRQSKHKCNGCKALKSAVCRCRCASSLSIRHVGFFSLFLGGQPTHTPPQRPLGAERKGRHKGRKGHEGRKCMYLSLLCVCVMLQLWTAQPLQAEFTDRIRRGQPAHRHESNASLHSWGADTTKMCIHDIATLNTTRVDKPLTVEGTAAADLKKSGHLKAVHAAG
eukprot:365059-Chlamydomonas_euryale.AAC.15